MAVLDSTNLSPPDFAPAEPVYPWIEAMVRVSGMALPGTNIYPGFVQQCTGGSTFRDRFACYIQEPNGIRLNPGIYGADLVNSYNGLPLFATTCCPSGSSSSSSPAGH